ncbi:MAG: TauD/TfdA dioxygenase family protein [Alphaproteobacteria bacterium]
MTQMRIGVHPIAGAIGAEISGIDLSRPMDEETFAEVRRAFHQHLVIFFRDQVLTPDQHKAFGRHFGELDIDRFVLPGLPEHPEIIVVKKTEGERYAFGNVWHADVTFYEKPVLGSALYALEVPPYGGDTLFGNMYLAYETLSDGLKRSLANLRAVHSAVGAYDLGAIKDRFGPERSIQIRRDREDEARREMTHPLVRTHPETGRKSLFVDRAYTKRLDGMTAEESRPLLEYLWTHQEKPEFTCRFQWRKGSLALWDNRCTHHYANNDYHGFLRLMHRVTICGDTPH